MASVLVGGVLCGVSVIILAPLAGAGRTLLLVAVDCLMLPCSGPCSSRKLGIVPSCAGAAFESWRQLQVLQAL